MKQDTLERAKQQTEPSKTAKLFKNGSSQAVRLPKEFRFEGEKVFIRREGDEIVLSPYKDRLTLLKESLEMFTDDVQKLERSQPTWVEEREPLDDLEPFEM